MKKLINISLTILALVFLSQSLSFAAQPPDNYLNSNLRSVYHGMGDGGTQLLNLTVREFVEMGLKKGSWEKASDIQWNYRMKIKDNVTGKVSNIVFAFSKNEKYFKDDVILFRIVVYATKKP